MSKAIRKNRRRCIAAGILLLLANVVLFLTLWMIKQYNHVFIDQFLFQMKASSEGVQASLAYSAVLWVGLFSLAATAMEIGVYLLLSGRLKEKLRRNMRYISYCTSWVCVFFKKRALSLSVVAFICCVTFFVAQMGLPGYIGIAAQKSDFIEDHYVNPDTVSLTFPEQKRNLVYIFLESMENTFADAEAGDPIATDYIPELTALASAHVNFSNTEGIGGALSYFGTTWTAAAMVSQTAGTPVKVPLTASAYGRSSSDQDAFMPGVVSLGEILEDAGYTQLLLVGSDADFHGRKEYFADHGSYEILDTESLKAAGRLPQEYLEWWGFEDKKLFAYAKEELTCLAAEQEPFNLTMLTADTHFPDGYSCELCGDSYESQYANVLSCSSKQVYEFVCWIQQQPFYENTTIVISGDHLTMDSEFLEDIDEDYVRTVYNCIINAPVQPVNEKMREFATFDMFPTTLAALGVEITGDRLGLGTNLFSGINTLTEQYGFDLLEQELQKTSLYYNEQILGMT